MPGVLRNLSELVSALFSLSVFLNYGGFAAWVDHVREHGTLGRNRLPRSPLLKQCVNAFKMQEDRAGLLTCAHNLRLAFHKREERHLGRPSLPSKPLGKNQGDTSHFTLVFPG